MKHQELRRESSLRLSDENREHFWGRIGSPVKETLTSRTTAETKKRELDRLRTGNIQLSVPGVSVLTGASRALLEAVPGAARQNHREDRLCCHLLTD